MIILAIESSCDETACAIVADNKRVLANVISSQIEIHQATQGVVPEIAARAHVDKLQMVLDEAFKVSGLSWKEIDAIAVTAGPGLVTSVMVGVTFASSLAYLKNKPLIAVNHVQGHLVSASLGLADSDEVDFSIAILSVSGGHNDLYLAKNYTEFQLLGSTQDDAAGEAYDKAAKMMGLEYPGGPAISKMALDGDPHKYILPKPVLKKGYEFSFSGLKSAFARLIEELGGIENLGGELPDLAASFQETINEVLAYKVTKAAKEFDCKEVHLVGGVSANLALREKIRNYNTGIKFRFPVDFGYCTDNAAMIAGAAFYVSRDKWKNPGEVPELIGWDS
jgi:N6-L-threonylcarbamoyladenine synthase